LALTTTKTNIDNYLSSCWPGPNKIHYEFCPGAGLSLVARWGRPR